MNTKTKAAGLGTRSAQEKTLQPDHNTCTVWLEELHALAWRFSALGIGADLASMSLIELHGVFCFLRRLAGGAL